MFKKIIIVFLIITASIAPLTVFAAIETNGKNNQDITHAASVKKEYAQTLSTGAVSEDRLNLNNIASGSSKSSDQLEPLLTDAWLLSLALIGFVMLSNRSGV